MMFSWNNPMVKGVLIGVGASLVGFAVYKRTDHDEAGDPYPLLYMKRT